MLGRSRESLVSLERALALNPGLALGHLSHGNALLELNQPAGAVQSFDRAIALTPSAVETLANRGRALRELERYSESLSSYDRALSIKPDAALLVGTQTTR